MSRLQPIVPAVNSTAPVELLWGGASRGAGSRLLGGLLAASLIAAGLFLLMMALVTTSDSGIDGDRDQSTINLIRLEEAPEPPQTKERTPPDKPDPPKEPPPPDQPTTSAIEPPAPTAPNLDIPNLQSAASSIQGQPFLGGKATAGGPAGAGSGGSGQGLGGVQDNMRAVRQVPPVYPSTARSAEIEGFVTMEFTVNPNGSVSDITVITANPPRMFDRAAQQALARWRFEPSRQDGRAVSSRARQTIRFSLDSN